jgi:hypothetical protein
VNEKARPISEPSLAREGPYSGLLPFASLRVAKPHCTQWGVQTRSARSHPYHATARGSNLKAGLHLLGFRFQIEARLPHGFLDATAGDIEIAEVQFNADPFAPHALAGD